MYMGRRTELKDGPCPVQRRSPCFLCDQLKERRLGEAGQHIWAQHSPQLRLSLIDVIDQALGVGVVSRVDQILREFKTFGVAVNDDTYQGHPVDTVGSMAKGSGQSLSQSSCHPCDIFLEYVS